MNRLRTLAFGLVAFACGPVDATGAGNADPQTATCATPSVMSCVQTTTCSEFYSKVAGAAARDVCKQSGTVAEGPCPAKFDRCCLEIEGLNGYPEGVCASMGDSQYVSWSLDCANLATSAAPTLYCAR